MLTLIVLVKLQQEIPVVSRKKNVPIKFIEETEKIFFKKILAKSTVLKV